jgi:branched-chain amino acid aminotransferase
LSTQAQGSDPSLLASVNGDIGPAGEARIPVLDEGLLRGDGAFEVIRIYLGQPFTLREHLDRLERTSRIIRLACPRAQIERELKALLAAAGAVSRDVRIVLTRGGNRILLLERFLEWEHARLAFVPDQPRLVLEGTKSLSYAGNMLAKRIAEERGFHEALLVSPSDHVMEAQTAAFFWVTPDGALCTPPLSEGILNSISRAVVLKHASVEEHPCHRSDALQASEAFLAGTAREIHPVAAIEDRVFAETPGPVTRKIVQSYWSAVEAATGVSAADQERFLTQERQSATPALAETQTIRRQS